MIYEMKLLESEFINIKYKGKIIEVRLNDEKRKGIVNGDKIIFYKLPNLQESILVYVEQVFNFPSFLEIYESFPKSYFGYNNISTTDMTDRAYTIYSKEEEKAMGVLAIKFKVERS